MHQQDIGNVDYAVEGGHDLVTKTCGELLRVIVLQLAALILEKLRDVAHDENLLEISLEIYALDVNLDDLLVFYLTTIVRLISPHSKVCSFRY